MRIRVRSDFSAYPAGKLEFFRSGETHDLPEGFARLLIQKGLAVQDDLEAVPARKPRTRTPADK